MYELSILFRLKNMAADHMSENQQLLSRFFKSHLEVVKRTIQCHRKVLLSSLYSIGQRLRL